MGQIVILSNFSGFSGWGDFVFSKGKPQDTFLTPGDTLGTLFGRRARRHPVGHSLGHPRFSGTLSRTLRARRARETPVAGRGVRNANSSISRFVKTHVFGNPTNTQRQLVSFPGFVLRLWRLGAYRCWASGPNLEPEVLQSGFGVNYSFWPCEFRNIAGEFLSEFWPLFFSQVFRPCFSRVSGPPLKIHAQN